MEDWRHGPLGRAGAAQWAAGRSDRVVPLPAHGEVDEDLLYDDMIYMRNLLGWLGTRLAQHTLNYRTGATVPLAASGCLGARRRRQRLPQTSAAATSWTRTDDYDLVR